METFTDAQVAVARTIYDFLLKHGATPAGAAGMLGNVQQECSFDPSCIESNGEGVGCVQWSFGRKAAFLAAASKRGVDWRDLPFQLDFMWDEIVSSYPRTRSIITTAVDPRFAALAIHADYEQSQDTLEYQQAHRAEPAAYWFARFASAPPTAREAPMVIVIHGRTAYMLSGGRLARIGDITKQKAQAAGVPTFGVDGADWKALLDAYGTTDMTLI